MVDAYRNIRKHLHFVEEFLTLQDYLELMTDFVTSVNQKTRFLTEQMCSKLNFEIHYVASVSPP